MDKRELTTAEKDAQGFALLQQLAQREGLHHYRGLLAAVLPQLKAQGAALVARAEGPAQ